MEIRKYKELKADGRVTIEPYGEKVIVKVVLFDQYTGNEIQIPEILDLAEVKKQRDQFDLQVIRINQEKENFDQLVADVEAASK